MTAILDMTVLAICLGCTAWRLPSALKGRNVALFWVFVLITVAICLSLSSMYMPVDALLGHRNVANLILRFDLYAIFFLLASKIAAAYQSPRTLRLVQGPVGLLILGVVAAGTIVAFALSDLPHSSTGLYGYEQQPSVVVYTLLGRIYPAFAAACLVGPTFVAARRGNNKLNRVAAGLLSAGFTLVVAILVLQISLAPLYALIRTVSYAGLICVAAGLSLVWISYRRAQRTP